MSSHAATTIRQVYDAILTSVLPSVMPAGHYSPVFDNGQCRQYVDGLGHKPLKSGQAFFQDDDKNDKTHRAQNVYVSRPT